MAQIIALDPITPVNGTPAPISSSTLLADSFMVAADSANSGTVIVKDQQGNTVWQISAGSAYSSPPGFSSFNLNTVQLDASVAGQVAYVSYVVPGGGEPL